TPGEPPTSTDVETLDDASGPLVGEDRLRPLIAAWLLSFKSPHTVRNYRHDLAHWLAFCADHGVDPLAARRAHVDAWARILVAHTGLRIGEALSRDVEHLAHDRGHRILRLERKGGRGGRTVLTGPVVRALEDYLAGRTTGPLFITTTGRRLDQPEAWRMIRRLARRAALDGAAEIRPHSLRVAFITGAREAGVPLEDVQDAAGHADPRTTRRYDRGRHSPDRHASYALTACLDGPKTEDQG